MHPPLLLPGELHLPSVSSILVLTMVLGDFNSLVA